MPPSPRLILASASPRRRELLEAAGVRFEVRHADVDEIPRDGEGPRDYVRRLAAEKASRVLTAVSLEGAEAAAVIVIGADTAVVVDDEILGKPEDEADARRMLRRLSGRSHLVLTGVSIQSTRHQVEAVEETTVWFSPLSADDLDWYVKTGEGRDKAGAYAIQGLGSRFVPRIEGSYPNVVGLPVAAVFSLLAGFDPESTAVASGS
jgi:septum formation protein